MGMQVKARVAEKFAHKRLHKFLSLAAGLFTFAFLTLTLFEGAFAQAVDPALVKQLMQQQGGSMPAGGSVMPSPLDQARGTATSPFSPGKEGMAGQGNQTGNGYRPSDNGVGRLREEDFRPSRLEEDYQQRTKSEIHQFGYDIFGAGQMRSDLVTGRIPDRYTLGVGDELVVMFQGQTPTTVTTYVDREGRIILPHLRPINAAGRSFADFRGELERVTKSAMIGTDVYVSLGSVRMISVYVLGEVLQPGRYNLTSLTTTLEALGVAGGIKKSGSLRRIEVVHNGRTVDVDLYAMLNGGPAVDTVLSDGDRIVVPPVGPTVAVTGDAVRPAIYELPKAAGRMTMEQLIKLAGGTLRPRGYAFVLNRMDTSGRQDLTTVKTTNEIIKSGDIVSVSLRENGHVGGVRLIGAVRTPGLRSLDEAPTLKALLGDAHNFSDKPYLLFGALERVDAATQARVLQPFSPERILAGAEDVTLKSDDRVVIFDSRDVAFLSSKKVRDIVMTGKTMDDCSSLRELARIVSDSQSGRFATAIRAIFTRDENLDRRNKADMNNNMQGVGFNQNNGNPKDKNNAMEQNGGNGFDQNGQPLQIGQQYVNGQLYQNGQLVQNGQAIDTDHYNAACPDNYEKVDKLLPFTLEYIVSVSGALRSSGVFPVAGKTSLASLVASAGGTSYNADLSNIEILSFQETAAQQQLDVGRQYVNASTGTGLSGVYVTPGSGVRINTQFSDQEPGGVLVSGEVRWPGVYSIRRGESLSELLKRAGGYTDQAFPYGAVFTRARVKEAEQEGLKRAAQELNSAMASAMLSKRDMKPESVAAAQALSVKISDAEVVGRVVIEADLHKLAAHPELDTVLESGDQVFIPKKPNYVLLIGDVLNPTALQFTSGKKVGQYLREAGGIQSTGDKGKVFVVYPNGAAKPVHTSSWGFGSSASIPPGSTVVVPKDPMPFDALSFTKDITQILSQLAISAASIAVISR
jgi:polysaccharide export outer membrane protein